MHQSTVVDNMKQVTYICDVCGATSTKPYKLHLTANIGKDNFFADVCCEKCAVNFAVEAAGKAGISAQNVQQHPPEITVAS